MAVDYKKLKKEGFIPQRQKNSFSLRIKVVGGNMNAASLRVISEVAERYGKGYVHFTSRQSVEIPHIYIDDIAFVKEALAAGGCVPSTIGPGVRTITACQGNAVCPGGCIETTEVAAGLDERYFGRELPHKFKIGVTGCQNNCLKAEENDLGIKGAMIVAWDKEPCTFCGICERVCRTKALTIGPDSIEHHAKRCTSCGRCVRSCPAGAWKGEPVYQLSFGGLFGNQIAKGVNLIPPVKTKEELFKVTDAAIDFFRDYGTGGERFKFTIDRVGWDLFRERLAAALSQE